MAVRSPVTVMPVLVGLAPGVTVTVRGTLCPAATLVEPVVEATAVGGVELAVAVMTPESTEVKPPTTA